MTRVPKPSNGVAQVITGADFVLECIERNFTAVPAAGSLAFGLYLPPSSSDALLCLVATPAEKGGPNLHVCNIDGPAAVVLATCALAYESAASIGALVPDSGPHPWEQAPARLVKASRTLLEGARAFLRPFATPLGHPSPLH